jgi:hypothetical protein
VDDGLIQHLKNCFFWQSRWRCVAPWLRKREGRGPHLSGSDGGRQLTERRNGVAALGSGGHDAKLQLFRVPEGGMRLLLVDSPAGEGELRRQLASALVELRRRHSTEPQQRQWCRRAAWPRHRRRERKEARRRSTAAPFKTVTARGSNRGVLAWGHATRRRGWGGAPARPVGSGGGRAGGRRASARGSGGIGGTDGWDPGTVPVGG